VLVQERLDVANNGPDRRNGVLATNVVTTNPTGAPHDSDRSTQMSVGLLCISSPLRPDLVQILDGQEIAVIDLTIRDLDGTPPEVGALIVSYHGSSSGLGGVCAGVRRSTNLPFAVLSPLNSEIDVVVALEMGADSYVAEPVSPMELGARLRGLIRRRAATPVSNAEQLSLGGITVNLRERSVAVDGRRVDLAVREFDVLVLLMSEAGRAIGRHEILNYLCRSTPSGRINLDNTMRRLRQAIERDPSQPMRVTSIRGVGYKFTAD
jgi:two-component system, OmpR family, response regulator RegX3